MEEFFKLNLEFIYMKLEIKKSVMNGTLFQTANFEIVYIKY